MRRLISLLAAVAIAAAPLAAAGGAVAKDHREQPAARGGPARQPQGQAYRGGGQAYGGGGYGRAEPRFDPRGDPRGDTRNDPRYDPRYGDYRGERADPRYDPRSYSPPPAYEAPRRGGYMSQGGPVIEDPGRYRLRPPPPGYDWVRTQNGAALVNRNNGRVFDVVPY
jgi:Ni/Co efflux regulator RcnB